MLYRNLRAELCHRATVFDGVLMQYRNVLPTEGNTVAANGKYVAFPWMAEDPRSAPVAVSPDVGGHKEFLLDDPMISGHSGPIQDLSFSPFYDNALLTASADTTVKVWVMPHEEEGLEDWMDDRSARA